MPDYTLTCKLCNGTGQAYAPPYRDLLPILTEIKRQLDWIGPGGRGQGNIVLSRDMAKAMLDKLGG